MDELDEWASDQLLRSEPERGFAGRVDELELPIESGDEKHVYRHLEEVLVVHNNGVMPVR